MFGAPRQQKLRLHLEDLRDDLLMTSAASPAHGVPRASFCTLRACPEMFVLAWDAPDPNRPAVTTRLNLELLEISKHDRPRPNRVFRHNRCEDFHFYG